MTKIGIELAWILLIPNSEAQMALGLAIPNTSQYVKHVAGVYSMVGFKIIPEWEVPGIGFTT